MYTEQDLSKMLAEVEKEFAGALAKAEEEKSSLAKSETANADAATEETAKVEEKSATAEIALAKNEDEDEDKDDCDYDDEDHEEIEKIYKSMSKSERKAHLNALGKCGEMSMKKSEKDTLVEIETPIADAGKEIELLKSEFSTKLAASEAKSEELKKNLDAVSEFLTRLVKKTAPQGKGITNLDSIAKSDVGADEEKPLSKSEISTRLAKKAAEPTLAKSDREAINAFYLQGANINTVNHLLK